MNLDYGVFDVCYAYYKLNNNQIRFEYLFDHLIDVYECMCNSPLTTRIARKYAYLINNKKDKDLKLYVKLIPLAGLLHDVSKGFEDYQNYSKLSLYNSLSFAGHELPTYFFLETAIIKSYGISSKDLLEQLESFPAIDMNYEKPITLLLLVALPILLHHYAQHEQRFWEEISHGNYRNQILGPYCSNCSDVIKRINEKVNAMGLDVGKVISYTLQSIERYKGSNLTFTSNLLQTIIKKITEVSARTFPHISIAAMGLLNACDGKIAFMKRF